MSDIVQIGDATLYHGDCMQILPTLPKVDGLLTDPPFGVGDFVQKTGNVRGRGESKGKPVKWNESKPPIAWYRLVQKLTKQRIIWGANYFNCFEPNGGAIVWYKHQKMPNFSKCDIASCTHYKKTEFVSIPWTNFTVTHEAKTDHPCERPVSLYEWCIDYLPYCDSFLDPYMGSGSVGVACVNMDRKFIGIEIDRKYFDAACERIEAAYSQMKLFK